MGSVSIQIVSLGEELQTRLESCNLDLQEILGVHRHVHFNRSTDPGVASVRKIKDANLSRIIQEPPLQCEVLLGIQPWGSTSHSYLACFIHFP